jgi:hypothetical protein
MRKTSREKGLLFKVSSRPSRLKTLDSGMFLFIQTALFIRV